MRRDRTRAKVSMPSPAEANLPDGLLAVLTGRGSEYCLDCVRIMPGLLDAPDATTVFTRDAWYRGGQCAGCVAVIPHGAGPRSSPDGAGV